MHKNPNNESPYNNYDTLDFSLKSISLNYKSWLVLLICLYFVEKKPIDKFYVYLTFFGGFSLCYFLHLFSHHGFLYPMNLLHTYHHKTHDMSGILLGFIYELFMIFPVFIATYVFDIWFLNYFAILYFAIFYSALHNIAYTIMRVNTNHSIHHAAPKFNFSPEIWDIAMGTKYKPEKYLENTDFYIPYILGGFIFIKILQRLCPDQESKDFMVKGIVWSYSAIFLFCLIAGLLIARVEKNT